MIEISIEVDGIEELAAALTQAANDLPNLVRPVVSKGALNIKNAMRADMAASEHFGAAASSITYDLAGTEAEIGPTKPAGAIANIAYFGGARGGGTVRDPLEPAEEEADGFEQALADIVGNLLG